MDGEKSVSETTVVVEEDESESVDTATVLDAVDAHVSANDAEDSAEESADHADASEDAALVSVVAAEVATESAAEAGAVAAIQSQQIAELHQCTQDLVTASNNYLQAAQLARGQQIQELPEPDVTEPEVEPDNGGSWYTRKMWGK
jgi:hypothetical protein